MLKEYYYIDQMDGVTKLKQNKFKDRAQRLHQEYHELTKHEVR